MRTFFGLGRRAPQDGPGVILVHLDARPAGEPIAYTNKEYPSMVATTSKTEMKECNEICCEISCVCNDKDRGAEFHAEFGAIHRIGHGAGHFAMVQVC